MIHRSGNPFIQANTEDNPMRLNSCAKILYRSIMSKFDIPLASAKNQTMNVSLPEQMEEFVRQKVAVGDYETASEVVREGLRLLKQRDDLWKAEVRSKIKQGMDSIRAGRSIPAQQVKAEMAAFKKKWKKNRSLE
jgi:antitoxin ParD1/3/4